ncbi:MAG TPA: discoidin domain-containing protein, partial [Vicinamibacterales bacterium]
MTYLWGLLVALVILVAPATGHAGLEPVNLALAKATRQSSTLGDGVPWKAVDGNVNGTYSFGSVTHTAADLHSWWEVDLGEVRQIGRIEITNRVDCCGERLSPFMVIVADFSIIDSDITDSDAALYPGIMRTQVLENRQTYSVPINRSGRFVRIALVNQNYLSLAEVKVFEAPNAAMGRATTQSSTVNGGLSGRAVDGSVNGVFTNNSVSTTNVEASPWWQVDLGMVHTLREIHIWSSNTDCCATANPKKGFHVWTSSNPITGDPATTWQPGATGTFVSAQGAPATVAANRAARYVRIQLSGTDALSLAEVQVWTVARGSVGGHATQSSFASSGGSANVPIDYNLVATAAGPTQAQNEPYWELDLGGTRYLETVRLWTGGNASLATYNLFVSNTPFSSTSVAGTRAQSGVSGWIGRGTSTSSATAVRRKGRFIRVMLDGWTALSGLGEVEIFTTEGVTLGNANGELNNSSPLNRQFSGWGYHSRPGTPVYAYAFRPNTGSGGGSYVYVGSATSSTTPAITGYAGVPLYDFTIWNF